MLLIEYVGHIGLRSLTDGHLGRHLEYFKTLNDARVASVGFIKYNASTTRINKEKNFKIKFQVILVFYRTNMFCFFCSEQCIKINSVRKKCGLFSSVFMKIIPYNTTPTCSRSGWGNLTSYILSMAQAFLMVSR